VGLPAASAAILFAWSAARSADPPAASLEVIIEDWCIG